MKFLYLDFIRICKENEWFDFELKSRRPSIADWGRGRTCGTGAATADAGLASSALEGRGEAA